MRPVLINDLVTAARALLNAEPIERSALAKDLMQRADWGDRYTRRLGKSHPEYGDGTLSSAARELRLAVEPTLDDDTYCECLELILQKLLARRTNLSRN